MRKRQMTMAKRAREQAVKEKRALKQEKKQAARDAKAGVGLEPGGDAPEERRDGEPVQDEEQERPDASEPGVHRH